MPKGMTPKNRMKKTTVSLARSLKPTGRLNKDDITRASDLRSKKSLSQMKDMKKLGKLVKNIATPPASAMGLTATKLSEVIKKAKKIKPTGRISKDDLERAKKMLKISFPKKLEAKGMTPSQRRTSAKRKPASAFPPAFRERRKKGTRGN